MNSVILHFRETFPHMSEDAIKVVNRVYICII